LNKPFWDIEDYMPTKWTGIIAAKSIEPLDLKEKIDISLWIDKIIGPLDDIFKAPESSPRAVIMRECLAISCNDSSETLSIHFNAIVLYIQHIITRELWYTEEKLTEVSLKYKNYFTAPTINQDLSHIPLEAQFQIFRRWFSDKLFHISNDMLISINTQDVDMMLKNLFDLEWLLDTLNNHNISHNFNK